jgi:hypothetical protein
MRLLQDRPALHREIGRWPNALRFGPDDTRDEVLMILTPL